VVDLTQEYLRPAVKVVDLSPPISHSQQEFFNVLSEELSFDEPEDDSDYFTLGELAQPRESLPNTYNRSQPRMEHGNSSTLSSPSWDSSRTTLHSVSPSPLPMHGSSETCSRELSSESETLTSTSASQFPTSNNIPPPPFETPPKLQPVEKIMKDIPGGDVASLRMLTTALAREAIFGREELAKASLSGRKNTGILCKEKVNYIKSLVRSRVPKMSKIEFEHVWVLCRNSLSKSCQTLRNSTKRKL